MMPERRLRNLEPLMGDRTGRRLAAPPLHGEPKNRGSLLRAHYVGIRKPKEELNMYPSVREQFGQPAAREDSGFRNVLRPL